ncbi:MAG: hypothetical protein Q9218_003692 [Villophora microphyllina]
MYRKTSSSTLLWLLYIRGALTLPKQGPVLTGPDIYTHTGSNPLACSIQTSYCGVPPSTDPSKPVGELPKLPSPLDSANCTVTYTTPNKTLVVPMINTINGSGAPCAPNNGMTFDSTYGPIQITYGTPDTGGPSDNPQMRVFSDKGQIILDSRNTTKCFHGTNQNPYAAQERQGMGIDRHDTTMQTQAQLCRRWMCEIPCDTSAPKQEEMRTLRVLESVANDKRANGQNE